MIRLAHGRDHRHAIVGLLEDVLLLVAPLLDSLALGLGKARPELAPVPALCKRHATVGGIPGTGGCARGDVETLGGGGEAKEVLSLVVNLWRLGRRFG